MSELVCEVCLRSVADDEALFAHRDLNARDVDRGFGPAWGEATPCHPACRPGLLRNPNWEPCGIAG